MLGTDATFDDVSFDGRDSRNVLLQIVRCAVGLASIGGVGAFALLHVRPGAAPDVYRTRPAAVAAVAPAAEVAANPFGAMIIEPGWISKPAPPGQDRSRQPPLGAVGPARSAAIPLPEVAPLPPTRDVARMDEGAPLAPPGLEAIAPLPSAAIRLPGNVPLPPARAVPDIADTAPLPPPRPAEFGAPPPAAPEGSIAQQNLRSARSSAPADNRNFIQKLFGLGQPSGPAVASTAPQSRVAYAAPEARATFTTPEGRLAGRSLFGFSSPIAGYDRWTAVYDISARTLYLPDGTRLEAHSGLGDKLDDPRYVSERMRGPTPPNVYELTPREASFHGVQALRLTPIGDSPLFGRAGLLAHPYMLGPNGDSNGCVSVKDYDALLRAYLNGQVKKLAVVARI